MFLYLNNIIQQPLKMNDHHPNTEQTIKMIKNENDHHEHKHTHTTCREDWNSYIDAH